jgi:hypothetical protein
MNKGKPSGFQADTKKDAGAKSTSRPRRGQAGAGPEWTDRQTNLATESSNASVQPAASERDDAAEAVNPFPEVRNGSRSNGRGKSKLIRFELTDGNAQKVCIAGTFNDWHPNASEMISLGEGKWRKDLSLEPGEYEYRFVIDGKWITDPQCVHEKSNGLGEKNSVIIEPES